MQRLTSLAPDQHHEQCCLPLEKGLTHPLVPLFLFQPLDSASKGVPRFGLRAHEKGQTRVSNPSEPLALFRGGRPPRPLGAFNTC